MMLTMNDAPNPRDAFSQRWSAIVPVKSPGNGKSRVIATANGRFTAGPIALAFALDTIEAIAACALVENVFVISDDESIRADLANVSASLILESHEVRARTGHDRLNAAIGQADLVIRRDWPNRPTFAITSDLPALRSSELTQVLREAAGSADAYALGAYLADASGTGTSMVTAGPAVALSPMFGEDSAASHRRRGLRPLATSAPTVRSDIDTYEDLIAALQRGVGPRTARIVALATD